MQEQDKFCFLFISYPYNHIELFSHKFGCVFVLWGYIINHYMNEVEHLVHIIALLNK